MAEEAEAGAVERLDTPSEDGLGLRCLMSNPDATLFANAGSGFIRLPLAMGLVALLVLGLFASGCETGPDHRVRDVEMTQTHRMDRETQRAVGRRSRKDIRQLQC